MPTLLERQPNTRRPARRQIARPQAESVEPNRWERRFEDLLAFKAAHGHCNVPSNYAPDRSLAVWVFNCRRQRKLGSLSFERIERLDAIDFVWEVRARRFVARDWDAMVAQLETFLRSRGHSNVPRAASRHRELSAWLNGVRCSKRSGRLAKERVRQLEELGIVWEPQQARWETMFAALSAYRRTNGDCNVPYGSPDNPALAKWVKGVRAAQKRGDLDEERVRRLDAIDFAWDRGGDSRWDEMYDELAGFRQFHGHCRISTLSDEHRALGVWVHTQRTLRKQGRLDAERIARLDALGFTWDLLREQWDGLFAALEEYRRETGHCNVPQRWADNRKLGNWVMVQRAAYKAGRLNAEQIERLRAIGFQFSLVGDHLPATLPDKRHAAPRPKTRRAA
jgi:hypothetical protein